MNDSWCQSYKSYKYQNMFFFFKANHGMISLSKMIFNPLLVKMNRLSNEELIPNKPEDSSY